MHTLTRDELALKTAFRVLVDALGGFEAAAAACRVGASTLHGYQDRHKPEFFAPVDVVIRLEAVAGVYPVTEAMARACGRALVAPVAGSAMQLGVATQRVALAGAQVVSASIEALADGVIDAGERARLQAASLDLAAAASDVGAALGAMP